MGESQATTMGLKTALTEMLGIEAPIIQGGMQHVGTAEMASAVSNAGGLGILTGLTQESPEALRTEIRRCRTMTDKPFGVNLTILPMLIPADYDGYAAVVAEEKVTMVEIAGGKPGDEIGSWVMMAKAASILTVPVVASGATALGRQLGAALTMGACGVTMATRFLATVECPIHQGIKDYMASEEADERSTTVVLGSLSNATRVFKNDVTEAMLEIEAKEGGINFSELKPYADGARTKKMWKETGDVNDSMWSCGQSVGLIYDVPTCRELVQRMVQEAEQQLKKSVQCCVIPAKL